MEKSGTAEFFFFLKEFGYNDNESISSNAPSLGGFRRNTAILSAELPRRANYKKDENVPTISELNEEAVILTNFLLIKWGFSSLK